MSNVVEEIRYNKVEDFINAISYKGDLYDVLFPNFIYRGIPTVRYDLIPTALRRDKEEKMWELCGMHGDLRGLEYMQIENENRLLKIFFKVCDAKGLNIPDIERIRGGMLTNMDIDLFYIIGEKWLPKDLYAIAALAQHYGLPTRLLDWSKDIFIALYFAAIEAMKRDLKDDYMVLWALNISFINVAIPPLKIINPEYSGNPNLCAQQGVFTGLTH